ncbi:MAG: hypothetical protein KF774_06500 [Planctomyces sp.]|nr:hypothetical protein [Planctomyces sp.]
MTAERIGREQRMSGHTQAGLTCPQCGESTVTCESSWSGFGDAWDNFRYICANPDCGHVEETLGIPGRFDGVPNLCPFCGRSTKSPKSPAPVD